MSMASDHSQSMLSEHISHVLICPFAVKGMGGGQDTISANHYVRVKLEVFPTFLLLLSSQILKYLCNILTSDFSVGRKSTAVYHLNYILLQLFFAI